MTEDLNNPFLNAFDGASSCGNIPWEPPTVAEAVAGVLGWHDLKESRRQALASALRTVARIAEADPRTLELSPIVMNDKVFADSGEFAQAFRGLFAHQFRD